MSTIIEEKFSKCGFTQINNGFRDKIRNTKLSQIEHEIIWETIYRIHGLSDSKKYVSLYQLRNKIKARHEIIKKYVDILGSKGFLKIIKEKQTYKIYTMQSYFCSLKKCYNCNPYDPKKRICQDYVLTTR